MLLLGSSSFAADPPSTAEVLGKLHHADQSEIAMEKLAAKDGQSKQVKEFGKMLVKDHTGPDKKVAVLAKAEKIDLGKAEAIGMADPCAGTSRSRGTNRPGRRGRPRSAPRTLAL